MSVSITPMKNTTDELLARSVVHVIDKIILGDNGCVLIVHCQGIDICFI